MRECGSLFPSSFCLYFAASNSARIAERLTSDGEIGVSM
jgi:hypothetical protein